ncbi:MAG: Tetracyclin repressor-like, C-terminal domain, partial [Pseudonocardiales bacterium]|nr:Tetracyclin repressor-like, C-terminal domain [Pseudonocardiales bacterium]
VESYRAKARALVTAVEGPLAEVAAVDTLLLVLALSTAWSTAPPGVRSLGATSAAARHAAHRAAVVAAATAVTDALTQA